MDRRFLALASNRLWWKPGDPFVWPYSVDVSVDGTPPKVALAEGVAHGAHGGVFTVEEALEARWARHFKRAEGTWLLPYLHRLAEGGAVTEEELVAHFTRLHGRPPETTGS